MEQCEIEIEIGLQSAFHEITWEIFICLSFKIVKLVERRLNVYQWDEKCMGKTDVIYYYFHRTDFTSALVQVDLIQDVEPSMRVCERHINRF